MPSGPPDRSRRLAYQPALDGLRAVAVTAVLLFHGGVRWMRGGYVGVSVFFTLSGFLITSLLIRERADTGRVAAGGFYARRARRLLPASALCLLGIVVLREAGAWDQVAHLRGDVWAAALQVFNWVRVFGTSSYGDLFARTGGQVSPVEHYWSLAIEEQFYWVWPLAFVGLARLARGRPSVLGPIAVTTGLAIAAGPFIATVWGPDAAYWATPARVGEILTGATAAALVAASRSPGWARHAAPACLAAVLAACALFPTTGGPAYHGWLPALSTVTALLLLGLQHDGPVRRLLSARPLVALGTISYGVYLYHWPIFTLIDRQRFGHGGVALLAVRLAVTLAVAIASYHLLERPIRSLRVPVRPTLVTGLGLTVAVLVAALAIPVTGPTFSTVDQDVAAAAAIRPGTDLPPLVTAPEGTAGTATTPSLDERRYRQRPLTAPTPSRPVRILVVGDSTAEATGGGLVRWAASNPDLAQVTIFAKPGCGFVQGGTRVFPDSEQAVSPSCTTYATKDIPAKVRELRPDVVVGMVTAWDVLDRRFPGTGVEKPTDPDYRRRIRDGYVGATEAMIAAGARRVLWLEEPTANPYWNPVHSTQEDGWRHAVIHGEVEALADREPDRVSAADLAWYFSDANLEDDHATRPDGVHLSPAASADLANHWLGPVVLHVAQRP